LGRIWTLTWDSIWKKGWMWLRLPRKSGGVLFGCVWGEDEHREYIYIGVGAMRDWPEI
jgi:hypothetical protein